MIRTVIIEAEQKDREKIQKILSLHRDFEVTALGKDGYDAIKMVQACKPDIAILGINLGDVDGLELSLLLKRKFPATSIIILASSLNDGQICKALGNEVAGFLNDSDLDQVAFILRGVLAGECYVSPVIAARIVRILSRLLRENQSKAPSNEQAFAAIPSGISKTELQIMRFIGEGHSNKEIAERMRLKAGTVRNYISSAIQKAGLRSRTQLAIYAVRTGLTGIARPTRRI